MLEFKLTDIAGIFPNGGFPDGALAFCAFSGGNVIGHCVFKLEGEEIVLIDLLSDPKDFSVADGLARAAINYAGSRGARIVSAAEGSEELSLFCMSTGAFDQKKADIDRIFSGCGLNCDRCDGGCSQVDKPF